MKSILKKSLSKLGDKGEKSIIREILKLLSKKGIVSFAGGLPSAKSFPAEDLKSIVSKVLEKEASIALQYGATEGDTLLRDELSKYYNKKGFGITIKNVLITASSQQALDIVGKMFIDEGDKIIVGLPSYLGAINAFKSYFPEMIGVKIDEYGMCSTELEKILQDLQRKGERVKFVYIVPDFQNPAGITMPKSRRLEILKLAQKYEFYIIEDSPYSEIRFEGKAQPTFYSLDKNEIVINLGTFSKVLSPGFRLGWIIAPPEVLDKAITLKQTMDLCTSPFIQRIAGRYMEKGLFEPNLLKIIKMYKEKLEVMIEAFEKHMPKEVTWTTPEGGLFLFLTLPERINTSKLIDIAIEKYKVAFVPGEVFHCDGSGKNTLRMNFSYETKESIKKGVKALANAIGKEI